MSKIKKINVNGQVYDIGEEVPIFIVDYGDDTEETLSKLSELINERVGKTLWLLISSDDQTNRDYSRELLYGNILENQNSYAFVATNTLKDYAYRSYYSIYVWVTWTDGIAKVTKISYQRRYSDFSALSTTNKNSYTPTADYHPATKLYVDTKFQEAIAMGFKVEVVEALPTEDISHQIIYLVLNGDTEEQNIYDEYIYNSNDEWEKIGSTKTDLSNYYNKQDVDVIISNILKSEEIFLIKLGGYSTTNSYFYTDEESLEKFSKLINKSKELNFQLPFIGVANQKENTGLYVNDSSSFYEASAYSYINFVSLSAVNSFSSTSAVRVGVKGTWSNGVFTCTGYGRFLIEKEIGANAYLSLKNNTAYTPTSDYNPATKKYVDDQLGTINAILATLTTVEESEVSE